MRDRTIGMLAGLGVVLQAGAIGLGFSSVGWRWPMAAAAAAVGIGILLIWILEGAKADALIVPIVGLAGLSIGLAAWHWFSDSGIAAIALRIAFGLLLAFQLLILAFLKFFKMNRLW